MNTSVKNKIPFIKGEYSDGEEKYTYPVGENYEGAWKDGEKNGQGELNYNDGKKYIGEWKTGKTWNGIWYDKNGAIFYKVLNGKWIKQ